MLLIRILLLQYRFKVNTHIQLILPILFRQSNLGTKFQTRNTSSNAGEVSRGSGGSGLGLAVGASIGLSIGLLAHQEFFKKLSPSPENPATEKVAPTYDIKLIEQMISQDRKINQLESQLSSIREDLRENAQQQASNKVSSAQVQRNSDSNVFELSEIIQANNLAASARHSRDLNEQRQLLSREFAVKVEGEILKVENKYRPTINKIRELEAHLESERQLKQKEAPARLLWLTCQSLLDKMRNSPQEPLEKDPAYEVLKNFAANDNQLAASVLDSIPAKALKEGVQSEESLKERFSRLDKLCKRVAMVDAHGGSFAKYLLSYLQSMFVFDNVEVSEDEIAGIQLIDPTSWSTFDILARARYCLAQNNLEQAVRYANQLRGQARVVARDWIRDARTHLATRQAFNTLSTHAETIAVDSVHQCCEVNQI